MDTAPTRASLPWTLDPGDPRAPPMDVWAAMTPSQRASVVRALPSDWEPLDAVSESSDHFDQIVDSRDRLRNWFEGRRRVAFVGCNLGVYYPGEKTFAPDIMVVLDVPQGSRDSWVVANEGGRGITVAIEVLFAGKKEKDYVTNVARYARLGIAEYFVVDLKRSQFLAYRLVPGSQAYQPIAPVDRRWHSQSLGLDLIFDGVQLRFASGITYIASSREAQAQLQVAAAKLSDTIAQERIRAEQEEARADSEKARADSEKARADSEKARADALALQLEALLARQAEIKA